MTTPRTPPHLITLVFLTAFSPLTLNMIAPSLVNIAEDLGTDYATVSLAIGGYLAVTALVQLFIVPLSDRYGRRPILLAALAVFAAASVGCALAQDVGTFLAFRMLQGGITTGYALSLAIVRDTREQREAASLIGYISMAMAIGPMLGPMVGGFLDASFGWRATFWVYGIGGALLLALSWVDLGETMPARKAGPAPLPLVLLTEPRFLAYALCTTFSTGGFFIFVTGAPLVATAAFGLGPGEVGIAIGTITAGFMVGSFLSGRYAARTPPTTMMLAGRLSATLGPLAGIILLLAGGLTPVLFFACTVFVGFGNGLTMPSSNAGALSVRPELTGSAAGLSGAMVVAGGAVLTTLTGAVLSEAQAALTLLCLIGAASLIGLAIVLWAIHLERDLRTT